MDRALDDIVSESHVSSFHKKEKGYMADFVYSVVVAEAEEDLAVVAETTDLVMITHGTA